MKTLEWVGIIGGALAAAGVGIYFAVRPDPLIGTTVRVPLSSATLSLKAGSVPGFPPPGLPGTALVRVTAVVGELASGDIVSFDSFGAVLGVDPGNIRAQFSKNVITGHA
jgi:hypothetical protein